MSRNQPPAKQVRSGGEGRDGRGRFVKGTSGNPRGRRPKGLATIEKLRTALADELPAIAQAVVERAKAGEISASKLILERVLPPLRAAEPPVSLGTIRGTRTGQGEAVLGAMASGLLSPGQTAQLLGAMATQAKIAEVDELERRLVKLEQAIGGDDETA